MECHQPVTACSRMRISNPGGRYLERLRDDVSVRVNDYRVEKKIKNRAENLAAECFLRSDQHTVTVTRQTYLDASVILDLLLQMELPR